MGKFNVSIDVKCSRKSFVFRRRRRSAVYENDRCLLRHRDRYRTHSSAKSFNKAGAALSARPFWRRRAPGFNCRVIVATEAVQLRLADRTRVLIQRCRFTRRQGFARSYDGHRPSSLHAECPARTVASSLATGRPSHRGCRELGMDWLLGIRRIRPSNTPVGRLQWPCTTTNRLEATRQ